MTCNKYECTNFLTFVINKLFFAKLNIVIAQLKMSLKKCKKILLKKVMAALCHAANIQTSFVFIIVPTSSNDD